MDTSENTDALLSAYAGSAVQDGHQIPNREAKKHMLFFQREGANGAQTLDEDQKTAALKILNVSRKKGKGLKVDGIVQDPNQKTDPKGGLTPLKEIIEEEESELGEDEHPETVKDALELIKKKNLNLIRKLAPDMPTAVATKIQGRTLASVGEHGSIKPPERYMYQFLAR
jgi:hypothetical protein